MSPNPPKRREVVEKDEGISDEEDTAELKLQLELNEQVRILKVCVMSDYLYVLSFFQETAVLRRKLEESERESEFNKRQIHDLQEKLATAKVKEPLVRKTLSKTTSKDPLSDKKIQVMEDEINELRKKLIEKDRDFERVQAEQSLTKGKSKLGILKNK